MSKLIDLYAILAHITIMLSFLMVASKDHKFDSCNCDKIYNLNRKDQ